MNDLKMNGSRVLVPNVAGLYVCTQYHFLSFVTIIFVWLLLISGILTRDDEVMKWRIVQTLHDTLRTYHGLLINRH